MSDRATADIYEFLGNELAIYVNGEVWHWGEATNDWDEELYRQYPHVHMIFHNVEMWLPSVMILTKDELELGA